MLYINGLGCALFACNIVSCSGFSIQSGIKCTIFLYYNFKIQESNALKITILGEFEIKDVFLSRANMNSDSVSCVPVHSMITSTM